MPPTEREGRTPVQALISSPIVKIHPFLSSLTRFIPFITDNLSEDSSHCPFCPEPSSMPPEKILPAQTPLPSQPANYCPFVLLDPLPSLPHFTRSLLPSLKRQKSSKLFNQCRRHYDLAKNSPMHPKILFPPLSFSLSFSSLSISLNFSSLSSTLCYMFSSALSSSLNFSLYPLTRFSSTPLSSATFLCSLQPTEAPR